MATQDRTPLTPIPTVPGRDEFQAILEWPFAQQPFYEEQVKRLLEIDIPQRVIYSSGRIWVYREPNGVVVGFGTLDLCKEYESLTDGKLHSYIPLLAVHPEFKGRGHGSSIVEHLIAEAVLISQSSCDFSDRLFLDVFCANQTAISLYLKRGFEVLNEDSPIPDPQENNEPYFIMAKNVAVAT
jgi:ribosomal protein S18 acetylase RimI-like enzyme